MLWIAMAGQTRLAMGRRSSPATPESHAVSCHHRPSIRSGGRTSRRVPAHGRRRARGRSSKRRQRPCSPTSATRFGRAATSCPVDGNATEAYAVALPKAKRTTGGTGGRRLLQKPAIATEIARRRAEYAEQLVQLDKALSASLRKPESMRCLTFPNIRGRRLG